MSTPTSVTNGIELSPVEREILRAVRTLAFGTVEITIHDRHVVEVARREKVRFAQIRKDGTASI
jgi:hypothetical protein